MPGKILNSQSDRKNAQKEFSFGGGSNTIDAISDGTSDYGYIIDAGGGDDVITGSGHVFDGMADTGTILDPRTLNGDLLVGGSGSDSIVGGFGDDWIFGGAEDGSDGGKGKNPVVVNRLSGDTENLFVDSATPAFAFGNDHISGGDGVGNVIYGDNFGTLFLSTSGLNYTGGSDVLAGGDGLAGQTERVVNDIMGDTQTGFVAAGSSFTGGADQINGGHGSNVENNLTGDAVSVSGAGTIAGGTDAITGGNGAWNVIIGDFASVGAGVTAKGGNDVLTGGSNGAANTMIGDVNVSASGILTGGDDRLISGSGADDDMWGDFGNQVTATNVTGGADTFEFAAGNGNDTINDLSQADGDLIDLIAFNFAARDFGGASAYASLDALMIDLITGGGSAIIDFGADDDGLAGAGTIAVIGWTEAQLEAAIHDVFAFETIG